MCFANTTVWKNGNTHHCLYFYFKYLMYDTELIIVLNKTAFTYSPCTLPGSAGTALTVLNRCCNNVNILGFRFAIILQ